MFSQPWAIPFLFSIPLSFGLLVGSNEAGSIIHSDNASWPLMGIITLIVNIVFMIETIFVADKWWYGLVLGVIAFLLKFVYDFIRSIILGLFSALWNSIIPWQIFEIITCITMPILCHILLYK